MATISDAEICALLQSNSDQASCDAWEREIAAPMERFVDVARADGKPLVLITSGGTTVPLERNTVRFVSNFSTGSRGSKLAECFVAEGWRVIFLHRAGSLMPYHRALQGSKLPPLDLLMDEKGIATVNAAVEEYRHARSSILMIDFNTVMEYLHRLRFLSRSVNERWFVAPQPASVQRAPLIVLAAAVSDYYVPTSSMSEHKISGAGADGTMTISFSSVPKALGTLRYIWAPRCRMVSFKLETDEDVLKKKALSNLENYGCDAVVANMLQNYTTDATIYSASAAPCRISTSHSAGTEMEREIVTHLIALVD